MARDAIDKGIKPAARFYKVSKNTVKKWLGRYEEGGTKGMVEKSRAPLHIPHKTSKQVEDEVIQQRKGTPYIGAKRLKRDFDIPCSSGAIHRILKERGMIPDRRKKKAKRISLRHIKDTFRAFEKNCIDTKHLKDIPVYLTQMKRLNLPEYEYTMRDMKTGTAFVGYSVELSLAHATLFAELVGGWLKRSAIDMHGSVWQSDGGSEFIGSWNAKNKSTFIRKVEELGAAHYQIPKVTYNADVETFHNTVEQEFFDGETYQDKEDFFKKATSYIRYYNLVRKNGNRGDKSPLDILKESGEKINPLALMLPALNLDALLQLKLSSGGHHVPELSSTQRKGQALLLIVVLYYIQNFAILPILFYE
ncbi:MAG: leucine zipper domain-containing protein [candidate division NC10 bacterium]